jgi:hypothetical protein
MVITKSSPYTKKEIQKLQEENKVCSAGCDRHFESEKILLEQGSKQSDLWGGGIDIDSKEIDYNSFINIRPADNNKSNEILDPEKRQVYDELTKYFFEKIYE